MIYCISVAVTSTSRNINLINLKTEQKCENFCFSKPHSSSFPTLEVYRQVDLKGTLRIDKTVTRNVKDDEDGVDEEEDGVDEEEEQEENEESDSDRKVSQTESDEGFGDSISLGFEMEEEEKDKVDIFTKSLDIDNLDLRNFLIVGDRKKKISDISEIIAYNRELRKQVLL